MNPSADPADLVHRPRHGTPGPHAPGVRMTAVLSKLPQISQGVCLFLPKSTRPQNTMFYFFIAVFGAGRYLDGFRARFSCRQAYVVANTLLMIQNQLNSIKTSTLTNPTPNIFRRFSQKNTSHTNPQTKPPG